MNNQSVKKVNDDKYFDMEGIFVVLARLETFHLSKIYIYVL
jgi:hypothetical protein